MFSELESLFSRRNMDSARGLARDLEQRVQAWRRARLGLRGTALYVLSAPLALTAVIDLAKGDWRYALAGAGAYAALFLGARINRRALRQSLIAGGPRYARPSRLPLKWRAGGLVALGTALAAHAVAGHDLVASALFGLMALGGFHLAYGLTPDPGHASVNPEVDRDARLRQTLSRAENRILDIDAAAETLGNPELAQRLQRITAQARGILDMIAQRPSELFRARRFLSVYLEGTRQVAGRYARTHPIARSRELEQNFRTVLDEIETKFTQQRVALLSSDVEDLDIHIEVLKKRLRSEGIV
jgi:hypothetical protein